ncbi:MULTISPECIES: ABC transporter permease [Microbacterium]|uniref:ABC transporter permease subunit n=1 Tax=Microbacterium wangchenii TaxID=2541726 RepID=A0ABX5SMH7_9MICO|nr:MULTISPECIES: ABC transporter permease subunit [Microbacterium]MCK6066344.1 ABC transporter permease subunit [Microbacterium sp. EYE_512]QBR87314.1 ABC transporter permease subunit [Microbacterium wangchenii]TFV84583.1 ABC transporter permease subunit [Microbacterium sp. dk485]TXK14635.1 ABC transporter permease subunit [Microbacterium wangchenii]
MTDVLAPPTPVVPAAAEQVTRLDADIRRESRRATMRALGRSILTFVLTLVAVTVIWVGALWVFQISPYVGKGPLEVWNFLVTMPNAAANRAQLFGQLGETLGHAAVGFGAGLAVALIVAIVFQLSKGIEHALMPLAMLLRSVPLVAMAPVIILIFGRDFASVAVIGGIVVLFPALVTIAFGLKSASPQMNDLISVYGGSSWTRLRKVALPSSLPEFFAAVRISVPGALTGALLAEWLAVGGGIGGAVGGYIAAAQFSAMWTAVVLVTGTALVLYNLVQIVESVVLARMGMADRS